MIHENQKILIYAMRYALAQHNTVVIDVCDKLTESWEYLSTYHRELINAEIKRKLQDIDRQEKKISEDHPNLKKVEIMDIKDREQWQTILNLQFEDGQDVKEK